MDTPMIEVIKLALSAGSFGLLVLVAVGAYSLLNRWAPQIIAAINGQGAALASLEATVTAKIDALSAQITETRERTSEIADNVRTVTGEHAAVAVELPRRGTLRSRPP